MAMSDAAKFEPTWPTTPRLERAEKKYRRAHARLQASIKEVRDALSEAQEAAGTKGDSN
jgi:exonuclease VII small subunit